MRGATYEIPNELVIMGEMGIRAFACFFRLPERLFEGLCCRLQTFGQKFSVPLQSLENRRQTGRFVNLVDGQNVPMFDRVRHILLQSETTKLGFRDGRQTFCDIVTIYEKKCCVAFFTPPLSLHVSQQNLFLIAARQFSELCAEE